MSLTLVYKWLEIDFADLNGNWQKCACLCRRTSARVSEKQMYFFLGISFFILKQ
jgi:hypothetical protein